MTRLVTGLLVAALWAPAAHGQAQAQGPSASTAGDADAVPMIVIEGLGEQDDAAPAEPAVPSVLLRNSTVKSRSTAPWLFPLRPLSGKSGANDMARLQGQASEGAFRLVLPPAALSGRLTLAHRSSVNVLPQGSEIEVLLNGRKLGSFRPDSFGTLATVSLPLAGSQARAGENIVTLRASQRHRIFCGPDASFALWTDLDLSQSGVQMEPLAVRPDAAGFVAALAAQAGGGQAVGIRGQKVDPETLRAIAGALGQATGGAPLPLTVASPWAVAERPAQARISLLPSNRSAVSVQQGGDGALVLVIEHPPGQAADPALITEALSGVPDPLTLAQPVMLQPGQETAFADLGFTTVVSSEYYFRRDLGFRLPEDWLLLASQKATVELDYGFAENLPEGGLVLVKVNGTTVRMLPLDRNGGKIQPRLPVSFSARLLRPGLNALSFESIIPGDPADEPCPTRDTDMLTILDSSSLLVPPSPKMQQPDMARTLSGLGGGDVQGLGQVGDGVLPFVAALTPVETQGAGALTVVGFADASLLPLTQRGIAARDLETVLLPPVAPAALAQPKPEPVEEPVNTGPARLMPANPVEPRSASWTLPGWVDRAWAAVRAPLERGIDRLLHPGDGLLQPWLAEQQGVAVLMSLEPDEPERLWLLLGPDADAADVAADLDAGRRSAGGPHGQISVLRRDGSWASWTAADARPVLLEPLAIGNIRPVLGNLVSWQPRALTAAMLGLAWITALLALYFVVSTRGNRKK
ncbi:cellulose synthase [Cereibacter changlensis JA139]|uniref:Cyclic di-GMP-binding protein n=2 Tax=Cereibacter changlensis TaxID=402884 RepID=A0A2T4JPS3_9RHOB|nr:cellulose biosynthesis cyclic di-GMP-binding regulatory protein BcsB [Cereibacter changlensis]PTE19866.1 cellulose synthase [Cereibacter changlensis JA139]PZX54474.1 cellulose synthase subunit [Cereibacter changlensis]